MFNVMLVDDEKDICDGLRYVINWEQYGFRVCATAYDGVTAFETALEQRPDLIITDIKMPRSDGLELISRLQTNGLHCYFIILSGFSDFAYAQSAVSLGVSNYLLKPVDDLELVVELEKTRDALYKEKSMRNLENARSALLQSLFLQRMATERVSASVLQQWKQYLLADFGRSYYVVMAKHAVSDWLETLAGERLGESLVEASDKLKETLGVSDTILFFKYAENCFGILVFVDSEPLTEDIRVRLNSFFLENFPESLAFGMCWCSAGAEHFRQACSDAFHNMEGQGSLAGELAERPLSNRKATEIIEYIDTHFNQCLDLQNLSAEVFHFHPFYVGKIIKKQTGLSFSEYLNTVRIQQSVKLLHDPKLSITDVSQQVGYRYMDHFYKNFRKLIGMTPGDYRKKIMDS